MEEKGIRWIEDRKVGQKTKVGWVGKSYPMNIISLNCSHLQIILQVAAWTKMGKKLTRKQKKGIIYNTNKTQKSTSLEVSLSCLHRHSLLSASLLDRKKTASTQTLCAYQEWMTPFRLKLNKPYLSGISKVRFLVLNKLRLSNYDEWVS